MEVSVCEFQSVFIELRNEHGKHLILGSIYRSPSFHPLPFIEYLDQTLDNISNERKLTILGGDMNLDILKHEVSDIISTFLNPRPAGVSGRTRPLRGARILPPGYLLNK